MKADEVRRRYVALREADQNDPTGRLVGHALQDFQASERGCRPPLATEAAVKAPAGFESGGAEYG